MSQGLAVSAPPTANGEIEVSIVMPCLNEAETLGTCIRKANDWMQENHINGEVIIADNGSTDGSQEIARSLGARVIPIEQRGYGSALMGGISAAHGTFIIMGDSDDSYDFRNLSPFLEQLRAGYDLVMGNRFTGGIAPGAMPPLHRYLGNPVLTSIGRLFFRSACGDFHCGLRGFRKEAIMQLDLRTTGMEFASEMVVKATLYQMQITEVPTTLSPDGRSRPPHLRSWRDGWRHLRFLLLYSPRWLFLYPGIALMFAGLVTGIWLLPAPQTIGNVTFDVHTLLYAAMAIVIGFQAIVFAAFTKIFAISEHLLPDDPRLHTFSKTLTLETGLVVGVICILLGLVGSVYAIGDWGARSFGTLDPVQMLRVVIPSVTLLTLGFQTILASFFLSVLGLKRK
jgi:glycosyltransferase involved in cell wall biosynthesis